MDDEIEWKPYVRTPFHVRAIQITDENIEAIARKIGYKKEVRILDGKKYIPLDHRMISQMDRAYIGWWITISRDSYRCYAPDVFTNYFTDMPDGRRVEFDFPEDEKVPYLIVNDEEIVSFVGDVTSEWSSANDSC